MWSSARTRLPLTAIALLAILAPSLAAERHRGKSHLSAPTHSEERVYLAGHDQADRSLHIEPLAGTGDAHCPGCILRQQGRGKLVERPGGIAWLAGRASIRRPEPALVTSAILSSLAPRAPPGL